LSEAACLELAQSLSVYCLSGWLPARRKQLIWNLLIDCLFIVCPLAACSSQAVRLEMNHLLFVYCLSGWLPASPKLLADIV
jgi:hypothetical protein